MAPKSPQKAAPGSGGNNKGRAASPKQKAPAKKAKSEEEEVVEEFDEEETLEEAQAGQAAGEGPATRTRAKGEGAAAGAAAKKTAASAAENLLPQPTIVDVLLGDHRDTVALLKHFEQLADSGDKLLLEKLTDAIALTIRLHSQAEFEVLYPLLEKRGGAKGKEGREHSEQEHAKIEEDLLKALEMRKEGSKELASTMKEVMDLFVKHLGEEENELVPLMLKSMTEEEQVEVAASFMAAKAKAPLMPQPQAAA